jgi:Ni,Fe-hydrogenase III small subunit
MPDVIRFETGSSAACAITLSDIVAHLIDAEKFS